MDIVYPIKKTETNEELRYSLRSLQNIPHNKVFIVGDLPDFVNEETAYFIPTLKSSSRYETTTNNIATVCKCEELSDNFILMNDDFFILNKISENCLLLNRGLMKDQVKFYHKNHGVLTNFDRLIEKGYNEIKTLGFSEPISFELHAPIIMNKYKFLEILPQITSESLHACKRSLYGNYFIKESRTIEDVKVLSTHTFDKNKQGTKDIMSCSEASWLSVKPFILNKFPNKSIYEK